MKQHHFIEIFSAGCPLCKQMADVIEVGRCADCTQTVYDVNFMNEDTKAKMKEYGVTSVPTTVIDGNIKVVGIPDFPWVCSDDLYSKLRKDFSMKK